MVKFYGRSVVRQYMPQKPTKYGVKLWGLCCSCCGYSITQEMYLGSTVEVVGGRQVVIQLAEPYFHKGHVIYCDRFFSHLDLAAYLRSVGTGMVGTSNMKPTSLPPDLAYLVDNMHPLTWCYKWYNYQGKIEYRDKQGEKRIVPVDEAVCVLIWMDKKYRSGSADKKVVFINNCLPAIPTSIQQQCQAKNLRDPSGKYTRQIIASPPILKAYNNFMSGVDRHDRMVGQQPIQLTSKRGYKKLFFHVLDTATVNAWILYKTAR